MQEARQFAERFRQWKQQVAEKLHESMSERGLPFQFAPHFSGVASYELLHADKSVEVYTLQEVLGTEGVGDVCMNLLESAFFPTPRNAFEQESHRQLGSGIIVYVQPSLDEQGNLLEQHLKLETQLPEKSSSDMFIVIVKSGAKFALEHQYAGGTLQSLLSRTCIIVLEEGAYVRYIARVEPHAGSIVEREVHCVSHTSHELVGRILSPSDTYGLWSLVHLLGDGAHGTVETVCLSKPDTRIDIGQYVRTLVPEAHESIRTYIAGNEGADIHYASSIDGHSDNKDSTDELWIEEQKGKVERDESKSHILRHETPVGTHAHENISDAFSLSETQTRMRKQ